MASNDEAETKELALVGKVEMRIALASSEDKLQTLLSTYLCPLLLKLASPSKAVREKVINICKHVNTRVKSDSIKLPVDGLLKQFKENDNALVRHFDLLYLQQGLPRVPLNDRLVLLPTILKGLSENYTQSPQNTSVLFHVFLRLVGEIRLPPRGSKDDLALRSNWGLDSCPEDARFVAEQLGKLMLFSRSSNAKEGPGLSSDDWSFLTQYGKESSWDPAAGGLRLIETKASASKLLLSGVFTDTERFLPGLFASADGNARISGLGEDLVKQASPTISFEDEDLVTRLFELYQGANHQPRIQAVRVPLKMKILSLLSRSKKATEASEHVINIVKETLSTTDPSSSPTGLEASKLRRQVFIFVNWVSRMAPKSSLIQIAPSVIKHIGDYITNQGWPKAEDDVAKNSAEMSARNYGYETLGLLAKACPQDVLIEPSLKLLQWLLASLVGDNSSQESSISIEDALASVLAILSVSDLNIVEDSLTSVLTEFMSLKAGDKLHGNLVCRDARYTVTRFANRCLPYNNQKARWINVLALSRGSSERHELIEEGRKGLDPYWFRNMNPSSLVGSTTGESVSDRKFEMPQPFALIEFFFTSRPDGGTELGPAFSVALMFCRNMLFHSALKGESLEPAIDQEWIRRLDALIANEPKARDYISAYMQNETQERTKSILPSFVAASLRGFTQEGFGDASETGKVLLETCLLGPESLKKEVSGRLQELLPCAFSSKPEVRSIASHILGAIAASSTTSNEKRDTISSQLIEALRSWRGAIGSEMHRVEGSITSLGYLFSRASANQNIGFLLDGAKSETLGFFLTMLFESSDKGLLAAVMTALNQWLVFDALRIDLLPPSRSIESLIEQFAVSAKDGNEGAVLCLGHLALQCPKDTSEGSVAMKINEVLLKLHEVRQPELHFSVGAAFACLAAGRSSTSLYSIVDLELKDFENINQCELLSFILEQILDKCKQTKPAMRQASVIWLLCIVQYCGHLATIQEQLRRIQRTFMGFLSDRESLSQESASRGLAIVYEKGDRAIKDDLIRDLVGSFTSTKSNLAGTVSEDTQLFEEGALPTGDGSVTTYKDIVNLASEVGDPSLVYRFMSLASNSSIWSSRAAFGRFGLSKILSESSEEGYLSHNPKLYPVLFRYRFDPNSNVRSAMNDIWSAIVKDPKTVIEGNFAQIIDDLLKNILAKEWRTRQASCDAIADLLQGRALSVYESYLTQIWTMTFKVCDDIKGSVRRAAMGLARVLTGILIRSLEAGEASSRTTDAMLKQIIPFLCGPSGMESSASDVRMFAIKTLLDIVKKGNQRALSPYLGELVATTLLPSLSGLEPEAVNYIHLKHDQYGLSENDIDESRLNAVKMSPMMEAIERCLDLLNDDGMKDLAERLHQTTKTVIGLPSSVGLCRVMVSLSTRHNRLFQPFAAAFLKLLRRQLLDRNDTVSTSAAAACGYICRIVEANAILKYVDSAIKMYFDAEDDRHRTISAEMASNLVKHATDRVRELSSSVVPFIYLGLHDTHEATQELFKAAWEDLSGSSRMVLLHMEEIIQLATTNLDSAKWSLKHASAFTVADLVKALGADVSHAHAEKVWPVLEKALSGRTWEGKHIVLEAFVEFISNSKTIQQDRNMASMAKKTIVRESKRNNTGIYRERAIDCLGKVATALEAQDWFETVFPIIDSVLESLDESEDDMDVDSTNGAQRSAKMIVDQTRANALRTLLLSINPKLPSIEGKSCNVHPNKTLTRCAVLQEQLKQTLAVLKHQSKHKDAIVQTAIFEGVKALFTKMEGANVVEVPSDIIIGFLGILDTEEMGMESTRIKGAEAAEAMADAMKSIDALAKRFLEIVDQWQQKDRSHTVQQILVRIQRKMRG